MLTKEMKRMAWQLELPKNLQPEGLMDEFARMDLYPEDWEALKAEQEKAKKTYRAMPWVIAGIAIALTIVVVATTKSKAKKERLSFEESLRLEFMEREANLALTELGIENEHEIDGQVRWYAKYQKSDNPKIGNTAEAIRMAFLDGADQEYDEAVDTLFEIGNQARDAIDEDLSKGDVSGVKWEIERSKSIKDSLESWYNLGSGKLDLVEVKEQAEKYAEDLSEELTKGIVEELKETA